MPGPYVQEDYEALAYAVLAGMPQEQAEKTLEEQRKRGGTGEELYWLTLKRGTQQAKTTIWVSQGLKAGLDEKKEYKRQSYEEVIIKIVKEAEKVPALEEKIRELEKKLSELENKEK